MSGRLSPGFRFTSVSSDSGQGWNWGLPVEWWDPVTRFHGLEKEMGQRETTYIKPCFIDIGQSSFFNLSLSPPRAHSVVVVLVEPTTTLAMPSIGSAKELHPSLA